MEDQTIVDLYWLRKESAIDETARKYLKEYGLTEEAISKAMKI